MTEETSLVKTLIKTNKSFLTIQTFINKDLIKKCVCEIDNIYHQESMNGESKDDVEKFDKLLKNPPIVVYGKQCIQHRSIGFFSDISVGYTYSGQIAKSQPLTSSLKELLETVNNIYKANFNGILVNRYEDGSDSIGKHSDDEKELDPIGVVCISYGSVRTFRIRDKLLGEIVKDIPTIPYELLHMGGDFQKEFTHEIPVQKKVKGVRYSFTFRKHTS